MVNWITGRMSSILVLLLVLDKLVGSELPPFPYIRSGTIVFTHSKAPVAIGAAGAEMSHSVSTSKEPPVYVKGAVSVKSI